MNARTRQTARRTTPTAPVLSGVRAIQLDLHRIGDDAFTLAISERLGEDGPALEITKATHRHVARIRTDVTACVRRSGHNTAILSFSGKKRIDVDEVAGVRLALIVMATAPLRSHGQTRRVADGISAMSGEEAYYWFARTMLDQPRTLKALRVLFSE